MFRRDKGTAKRFDAHAITLAQLQTLKERVIAILGQFLSGNVADLRGDTLNEINAIQAALNTIAVRYALDR